MKRLHDKLKNWESTPPPHIWDRVSSALDDSEGQHSFPERLRNWEAPAPAAAWSAIAAKLDGVAEPTEAAPVIIRRSRVQWMRYAAAVALLALALWGGRSLFAPSASEANPVAQTESNLPAVKIDNDLPTPGPHVTNADSNQIVNDPGTATPLRSAGSRLAHYANEGSIAASNNEMEKSIYVYEDHRPRMAENYVTLLTPEGSFIRISKKWSNLLCCIAGEDEGEGCQSQLKEWQDQMASSPVAPGPGSFMDILDLVNSLSEGTQL